MMFEEQRRVHCHVHGERLPTFVCRHLVRGAGLGFYEPDRTSPSGDETGERCAWCAACERVRQDRGGWDDESEAFAGVTLICDACFQAARVRNLLRTEPA
jgi:hypothetical protein